MTTTVNRPIGIPLHPTRGEGDHKAPHQPNEVLVTTSGPTMGKTLLGQWHAFRGRPIQDELVMEFHRQLDHVAVWIEKWSHDQKCQILEGILTRSNFSQFGFLWTSLQPTLHRDFMYTSQQIFPEHKFTPISSYVSRETRARRAVRNYYHVGSAHLQRRSDVTLCNAGDSSVHLGTQLTRQGTQSCRDPVSRDRLLTRSTTSVKLPRIHSRHPSSRRHTPLSQSAPASLTRFITDDAATVRRHMQDRPKPSVNSDVPKDYSPVTSKNLPQLTKSLTQIQISRTRPTLSGTNPRNLPPIPIVPDEAWQLYHWYEDCWNDVQRNEFLHKILKRLDSRQLYFLSSSLALKQSRDFIALLAEPLALRILQYLSPKSLLVAAFVSRTWCRLTSHDTIWKVKCDQVVIAEIPLPNGAFRWKTVYRDNVFLRQNWESGKCKQIDVRGHTAKVLCVTFDGLTRLASGSKDSSIKIWDIHTGSLLQTLKGHTKGVWCLSFFTRYLLASSSFDGTVKVWNLRSGVCTRTMFGHEGPIWAMVQKGYSVVTASQDRTLKLWDLRTCLLEHTLVGHTQAVFCVDMDDECSIIISGSADRSIRVWSTETGRYTKVIWASQTTSIMALSYHRGYFTCAVGEIVSLWRLDTANCIKSYEEHEKRVESVGLRVDSTSDPDNPKGFLVTAGQDGMVKYWNLDSNKSNHTLSSGTPINSIYFDQTRIIGACSDYKLKIWNFNTTVS